MTDPVTIDDWDDGDLLAVGRVPDLGFEWRRWDVSPMSQDVTGTGPWLCLKERGPQIFRRYPVLRQHQTLTEFVAIDREPMQHRRQAVLDFANRRGALGQRDERGSLVLVEDSEGTHFPAEDYWFWVIEVSQLAALVELHNLIPLVSKAVPDALASYAEHVLEIDDKRLRLGYGTGGMVTVDQTTIEGRHHRADLLGALIREAVERKLRRSFSPVFRPNRLVFMPASLLEALYLAFAVQIVGGRPSARLCRCGCGEEFYPKRRDQQYLDEAHGARDRRRRIRAKQRGEQP